MNAISLFSGAMGLDLGIEKAGFEIKVCVEMDKWAVETIKANTNIPVIDRDINLVPTDEILSTAGLDRKDVTLVVGGPPCQAFSTAGKQRGLADFRGNVILQYLRVVSEIQPPYFILENVRGLMSAKLNQLPLEYEEYNKLGTSASMGCVRMCVRDVKWVYDFCNVGTTVEFYDDEDDAGELGHVLDTAEVLLKLCLLLGED